MRAMADREGMSLDVNPAVAYKADDLGGWKEAWYLADDQKGYDEFFQ